MVVQDGPGFVVNRLLFPYLNEALELLREGVPAESIERAAAEFGMTIGPLRLMDEIGLDTTLQAAWVLAAAFPERDRLFAPAGVADQGRPAGAKDGGRLLLLPRANRRQLPGTVDKAALELIAPWITHSPRRDGTSQPVAYRLVLPMLLEATRILEEGKVRDVRDIDLAVLFGLGFPGRQGRPALVGRHVGSSADPRPASVARCDGPTSRTDSDAQEHGRKRTKILSVYCGNCLSRSKAGISSGWSISLVRPFCKAFSKAAAASLCFPA